jgi:hypothetical protein
MSGCDERVFDHEHYEENLAIWNTYGSELAGDFGTKLCGKPVVRAGKCEQHKVERRKEFGGGDRRYYQSCDSPPSCGNGVCRTELVDGKVVTRHHTMCPDYGPGWA